MKNRQRRLGFESLEFRRLLAAVAIPTDLQAAVGSEISAPITIDAAAGLRGAEIRLTYDPTLLDLQESDILAGSVWATGDTQVTVNLNAQNGEVVIFVASPQLATTQAGSLVTLGFTVRQGATVGSEAILDLVHVRLNEGAIPVTPAPAAGADATDGKITVTADDPEPGESDRIAGTVYADANNDRTIGDGERLPGVTITLIHVASGQQQTAVTDDLGQFQFTNLPAGQYRLLQTQPVAYLDGGDNELALTLAAGQNLAGQDFRELGLRAAYLGNRLATTVALSPGSTGWTQALRTIQTLSTTSAVSSTLASNESIASAAAFSQQSESADSGLSGLPAAEGERGYATPPIAASVATADRDKQVVDAALQQTSLW